MKKLLTWAVVAVALIWLVDNPTTAAYAAGQVGELFARAADAVDALVAP